MPVVNIIRAWKDAEYRRSLSLAQREGLPAHPAAMIELAAAELDGVCGAKRLNTKNCPTNFNCSLPGMCNSNGTGGGCTQLACCRKRR